MAVVSGFFNSVSGDRKYNADHFGRFFDGLLHDGVYVNYPEKKANGSLTEANERGFYVSPGSGVAVNVAPGRCFFDHCWMYNDSVETINLNPYKPSNSLSKKLVAIFIEVDTSQEGRQIIFKVVAGNEVANDDQHIADPPSPVNTATRKQYPIALIAMNGAVTAINDTNIYRFDATYTDYRKNYFARTPSVEALLEYSSRTKKEIDDRINAIEKPTFTEASTAENINSGENINTIWGKIKKALNQIFFNPGTANANKIWKVGSNGKASWQDNYGVFSRSAAGIVPHAPSGSGTGKFLREDGSWSEPVGTNTNAETVGNVRIGVSGGKYGYWDGNTFKPFKDPTGTASAGDVLSGKTFANAASNSLVTGTMPDRGAVSKTLNVNTTSYTIPFGYHSGLGSVSITTQEKTVNVTGANLWEVTPDAGCVLSKVNINTQGSYNNGKSSDRKSVV